MTSFEVFLVALSGLLAGVANTAAGGGTLISYPALVFIGMSPISANISSAIGLLPGYVGGSLAYRTQIAQEKQLLARLAAPALLGGVLGAVVLLNAPEKSFQAIAPYFVILGSVLFLLQPLLVRSARRPATRRFLQVGVFLVAGYGAYFSAGVGVILFAFLSFATALDIQRSNGIKNALSLIVIAAASLLFAFSGQTNWTVILVLMGSSLAGGYLGGRVAKKLTPTVLRVTVASLGCVLGVALLFTS